MWVYFNNVEIKVPVAGQNPIIWSAPKDLFKEGVNSVSMRFDDFAKNPGATSVFNLNLDTTAPTKPRILFTTDDVGSNTSIVGPDGRTDDQTPVLTGIAEKNSLVTLYNAQDEPIGSVYADNNGLWEIEAELAEGEHQLYVTAEDNFGHVSNPSDAFKMIIGPDLSDTPPGIALITYGWDDSGENVGELSTGALTSDTTPQLFGSAPADSIVRVQYRGENGSWTDGGTAVAGPNGEWNWTAPVLGAGNWEFRSSAATSGGWSDEFVLEINPVPQNGIEITHAWDSEGAYTGELRSGALTDDNKPQLFGRAEANSLVYVHTRLPGGEWERVGSAHAGPDGRWTLETERLSAGSNELIAGNSPAAQGGDIFNLEVVTADPAAPQIVDIYDNTGPITGYMGNPDVTDDRTPRLEGRAPTGAVVVIYQDGVPVGSVVAAGGLWRFEVPALTEDKSYSFTSAIRTGGIDGPQSAGWELVLNTSNPTDVTLEITSMTADSGISDNDFITNDGSANRTLSGTLSRELAQGERVLVHNGNEWLLAVVDGLQWSVVDTRAHSTSWRYQAKVENAVIGADSVIAEQEVMFNNVIAQPVITGAYNDAGETIANGGQTNDSTPKLTGTAEADSIVYIFIDGIAAPVGSVVAEKGQWEFTATAATTGSYTFYAKSVDQAGNSAESAGRGLTFIPNILKVDFENYATQSAGTKEIIDFDIFTLQFSSTPPRLGWPQGVLARSVTTSGDFVTPSKGIGAWGASTSASDNNITIKIKSGIPTNKVKFQIGEIHTNGTVAYYNESGTQIHSANINVLSSYTALQTLEHTMPAGEFISKIEFRMLSGEWIYLDNFEFSTVGNRSNVNQDTENTSDHHETDSTITGILDIDDADKASAFTFIDSVDELEVINGGDGVDTLVITGAQQTLVLSDVADKLNSVEVIDITGSGDNRLALNVGDVLDHGGRDLFVDDGKLQFMVQGNEGDTVQLDDLLPDGTDSGDWIAQNGTVTVAGVEYQVFSHSGEEAEVLIQQGIKTELI